MKYNIEYALAVAAKAYCESALDASDFANWPVVTWFDPMAIDPGNRVVCICQTAQSSETSPGNFACELEVGVRTDWAQPTVETDQANHFDRVAQVRDIFNAAQDTLVTSLIAVCPAGFSVHYVDQRREYATEVNEGNYYSSVKLNVQCHAIAE